MSLSRPTRRMRCCLGPTAAEDPNGLSQMFYDTGKAGRKGAREAFHVELSPALENTMFITLRGRGREREKDPRLAEIQSSSSIEFPYFPINNL